LGIATDHGGFWIEGRILVLGRKRKRRGDERGGENEGGKKNGEDMTPRERSGRHTLGTGWVHGRWKRSSAAMGGLR